MESNLYHPMTQSRIFMKSNILFDVMDRHDLALIKLEETMKQFYFAFFDNELKDFDSETQNEIKLYIQSKSPIFFRIRNRFYIHTISNIKIKKNKITYKDGYVICAELQFVKKQYIFATYAVTNPHSLNNKLVFDRPDSRLWRTFINCGDLLTCLHDSKYYSTM